jgi:2-polyprenyl-6-methoxyphenol hydroxylase-like FAD-dependent oxidoreductase
VLIMGAGPAGMVAGMTLAGYGIDVLLVSHSGALSCRTDERRFSVRRDRVGTAPPLVTT